MQFVFLLKVLFDLNGLRFCYMGLVAFYGAVLRSQTSSTGFVLEKRVPHKTYFKSFWSKFLDNKIVFS